MNTEAIQILQILVGAAVTAVSQYAGYLALSKKLDAKADKKETDQRLKVLEGAHGGVVR
jgi:hypothetical protein